MSLLFLYKDAINNVLARVVVDVLIVLKNRL